MCDCYNELSNVNIYISDFREENRTKNVYDNLNGNILLS